MSALPSAIVTGAASGIGRACALLLNERGYVVVAADRDAQGARETAGAASAPRQVRTVGVDVTDPRVVAHMVQETLDRHGRLDALVTAAGIPGTSNAIDAMPVEDWDAIVDTSLRGTYLTCKAAIPVLRQGEGGAIVTFGSVLGRAALPGGGAYSAAKAGIEALTRALAIDHAREGIRANCVVPGSTDTPLMWSGIAEEDLPHTRARAASEVPLGRIADPDEIARAVCFLLSGEASFITGASLVVDGGITARSPTTY